MYVTLEHSAELDYALRELAVQRVRRAMHGFALPIRQAHLHLSNALNLRLFGGKRCWAQITVGDSIIAIGVAQAPDWREALDKALARAVRSVPNIQRRLRANARIAAAASRDRLRRRVHLGEPSGTAPSAI
jgi:hypothetical protein